MSVNPVGPKSQPNPGNAAQGLANTGLTQETAATSGASLSAQKASAAYGKQSSAPTASQAAHVQISPKAKELSLAKKIVEDTPDVREDKVNYFKDLIAKGAYKPDASKIADGMMREAIKDELSKDPDVALS